MEPCQSSMCFNKPINYSASDAQIKALMEISESCTQYIEVKPGKTYFFTRMLSLILLLRLLFQSYVYDGCTVFRMCNAGLWVRAVGMSWFFFTVLFDIFLPYIVRWYISKSFDIPYICQSYTFFPRQFECKMAPLSGHFFWLDSSGQPQSYLHGNGSAAEASAGRGGVCGCSANSTCRFSVHDDVRCNCDVTPMLPHWWALKVANGEESQKWNEIWNV